MAGKKGSERVSWNWGYLRNHPKLAFRFRNRVQWREVQNMVFCKCGIVERNGWYSQVALLVVKTFFIQRFSIICSLWITLNRTCRKMSVIGLNMQLTKCGYYQHLIYSKGSIIMLTFHSKYLAFINRVSNFTWSFAPFQTVGLLIDKISTCIFLPWNVEAIKHSKCV